MSVMVCPTPDSSPLVPPEEFTGIMAQYDDTACHDTRFTPEIRREVELKCRDILEKSDENLRILKSTFPQESNASSSTSPPEYAHNEDTCSSCTLKFDLLNNDGPVALLKRFVVDSCAGDDSATEWRIFLGFSTVSDGVVGISPTTFDFPWLTLLLNRWIRVICHASRDERQNASIFSSWELLFHAAADKGANSTASVDPAVLRLPPPDITLLERLGFAIPQPGDEKLKSLLQDDRRTRVVKEELPSPTRVRSRSFIGSKKRRLGARSGSPMLSGASSLPVRGCSTVGNPWKRRMLERENQTVMLLQREQHSSTQQSQRQLRIQKYAEQRRKFIQLRPKQK